MKRIFYIILLIITLAPLVRAEDCMHDPINEVSWNGEVTIGMRVRDIPCMETSTVLATVPVGEVVKVIAETDGYYKVQLSDGTEGWSGQQLLKATDKPFTLDTPAAPKEPLYDVVGHAYETAIRYLYDNSIIQGYADGSYKPDQTVNRAEFTKIIVGAKLGNNPTSSASNCFPDVKSSEWYASYVCYAKNAGIIGGYPDGTFKPSNTINLAEAAKILVNTLDVEKPSTESSLWYRVYIEALQNESYIPSSFTSVSKSVTRGEMAEMIWRIKENMQSQPSAQLQFTEETSNDSSTLISCADASIPSNIDMSQVRQTWLDWYNGVRADAGLSAYTYNSYLNDSATTWSEYMKSTGSMSHMRPGQTSYYDYAKITDWFKNLGLTFNNEHGVTYSENIGAGTYRCSSSDCTQTLINAIKNIFDGYMAEKGTSYTAHYDSVMNKYFKEIGLGISIDTSKEWFYLTVHYTVGLASHPGEMCD